MDGFSVKNKISTRKAIRKDKRGSISISVITKAGEHNQLQRRFPSVLAKDPPIHHHGLRTDRNRRLTT